MKTTTNNIINRINRSTKLNLGWYDLSVAGLVLISTIGAIVRIAA